MIGEFPQTATPDEVCDGLSSMFGAPFHRWRKRNGTWSCLEDSACRPADALQRHLDRAATCEPGRPTITQLDAAKLLIGACVVDEGGGEVVVAGEAPADATTLAMHLAQVAVSTQNSIHEQAEQRVLLESYANKLADSYEELSFLRRLSQHVEYCDASNSLVEVAEAMIPSLRELMAVEGLALFTAEYDVAGRPRVTELAYLSGKLCDAQEEWFHAIESLTAAGTRIVVKNFPPLAVRHASNVPLARVRSVVIAPIVKEKTVFGWLVGINKRHADDESQTPANSLGFDEIGTIEATLLQSAAVMLATHAANVQLFQEKEQLVVDTIHTLVGVIEAKDSYTSGHSDRVALLGREIAEQMGLSVAECHDIYLAGLLHDIGKVGVSDDVLLKPGRLTEQEFAEIRRHPEVGQRLLQRLKPLRRLLPGVMHHHESMDGSGYPHGLAGEDIPQMARILAVADAWDAMTSDRPYRNGMPEEKAEAILRSGSGQQWDADAVAAFFAARETIREVLAQWRDDLRNILAAPWDADTIGGGAQPRREPEAAAEAAQPAALELPANPV
ncbi:MAG: HD-GYP domain-containing protein [Planctomycetales bacterium]|nr:HD-GYP domain-containing protein [Planctomycetales bacterium]